MENGGESADQLVRMSLQGIEIAANVAFKVGGEATKSLAAMLYAILTDKKRVKGKTRLNTLLKSGKELKVYAIKSKDLKKFCEAAKQYGVLYCVLKEKNNDDGICDIMVRAEDAAKISRIVDRYELATVDTKAIRESIQEQKDNVDQGVKPMTEQEHDALVKQLMDSLQINPNSAQIESNQKDRSGQNSNKSRTKTTGSGSDKKSVRKKLDTIKKQNKGKSQNQTVRKQKGAR